jgi:tRNA G10  N-methylase Trm11
MLRGLVYGKVNISCSLDSLMTCRVGDIKRGDVVCDPMCGLGTILIEAAKSWPSAHYIGNNMF